jgi:hypothetical protein
MSNIAFDMHGVLDKSPGLIKPFMRMLTQSGNDVLIMSGPPADRIVEELRAYGYIKGVHYTGIASVVDFLKANGVRMWLCNRGMWHCSDKEWWESKGQMCALMHVDILFDNDIRYALTMPKTTKFVLFKSKG